jgi:hypothetical protein
MVGKWSDESENTKKGKWANGGQMVGKWWANGGQMVKT